LAERLRAAGCSEVTLEEEDGWGTWPPNVTGVAIAALLGGVLVARGRRFLGGTLAAGALAGFVDEIENGPRILRRAVRKRRTTTNVVAVTGDVNAERTLVVLAHHDAAQTGFIFDQTWAKALYARWPAALESGKKQIPQWWLGVAPSLLTLFGAVTGRRRPVKVGLGLSALGTAAVADILRNPTVPGANDNLSGVAVLTAMAEALKEAPVQGLRVILASCGAEESFQDGIRGFVARHRAELLPERTWFLNFDTVGSPDLVMLEGEGPVWMEDYSHPSFRDLVAACAHAAGIRLERGLRARASTDSVIPSRAGYPTATLISLMPWRMPGNYHQLSDVPANVNFQSLKQAARLGLAVVHALRPLER
jgi:hypothetical protein